MNPNVWYQMLANNLHAASLLLLPFVNDDIDIKFTKIG